MKSNETSTGPVGPATGGPPAAARDAAAPPAANDRDTAGRRVAAAVAIAVVGTVAPVIAAAGLSAARDGDADVIETVRTVTLGGVEPAYRAVFDVPEGAPDCDRKTSQSPIGQLFVCGDVTIDTRSAQDVDDPAVFGQRAVRATVLANDPVPHMEPADVPQAPGMTAWTGSPVTDATGKTVRVIVLADGTGKGAGNGTGEPADENDAADNEKNDAADGGENKGTSALVAVVSGDAGRVDDAVSTILSTVREGGAK